MSAKRTTKDRIARIYIPRPNIYDTDSEDHRCESEIDDTSPDMYFNADDLLGRYEPIHKMSIGNDTDTIIFEGKTLKQRFKLRAKQQIQIVTKKNTKQLLTELRALNTLKANKNILKLYDIIPPKDPLRFTRLTIILEHIGTNLGEIFRTSQFFTKLQIQYILNQILSGVEYIHSFQIAHQRLNPSIIFINEDCSIKISGFGDADNFDEKCNKLIVKRKVNEDRERKNDGDDNEEKLDKKTRRQNRMHLFNKKVRRNKELRRTKRMLFIKPIYKSPEVILSEHKVSTLAAGDIWSIGAIFAELLQMQRENRQNSANRKALFVGDFRDTFICSIEMNMPILDVFDIIGSPEEHEIAKLSNEGTRSYLRSLPKKQRKNLRRMLPGADREALELLSEMLRFDVDKRITAIKALEHRYLKVLCEEKKIRRKHRNNRRICLFESVELKGMSKTKMRYLIMLEVYKYNNLGMILDGYIRKHIEPFLGIELIIPVSVISICFQFLGGDG